MVMRSVWATILCALPSLPQTANLPTNGLTGLYTFNPGNVVVNSEQLSQAPWNTTRATIAKETAVSAPQEISGANVWRLTSDFTASSTHQLYQYFPVPPSDLVLSVYVKPNTGSMLYFAPSSNESVWFNLRNGTSGTQGSTSYGYIAPIGGGWYRLEIDYVATSGGGGGLFLIGIANRDGVSTMNGDGSSVWIAAPQVGYRSLGPYHPTDMLQVIQDTSGQGHNLIRGLTPNIGPNDPVILPSGGWVFDGSSTYVTGLPAKGPVWTVVNASEGRVESVDSSGGSYVNGVPRAGASEWNIGVAGGYRGHLTFLARYGRVLSTVEQAQAFQAIVQVFRGRPGYEYVSRPVLSFSFDDCQESDYSVMLPMFQSHGVPATSYVITRWLDSSGTLTSAQVRALHAAGWEIGSHTIDHVDLRPLTDAQLVTELAGSKAAIQTLIPGYTPTSFAYPGGYENGRVRRVTAQYYQSARIAGGSVNGTPFSPLALTTTGNWTTWPIGTTLAYIDKALASGSWLVLAAHATTAADAALTSTILNYAAAKGVPVMTMTGALNYQINPLFSGGPQ